MPPKAKPKAKNKAKAKAKAAAAKVEEPPPPPPPDPEKCAAELKLALEQKPVAFTRLREALAHAHDANCDSETIDPAKEQLKTLEMLDKYLRGVVANGVGNDSGAEFGVSDAGVEFKFRVEEAVKLEMDVDLIANARKMFEEYEQEKERRRKEDEEARQEIQKLQDEFEAGVAEVEKVLENAKKVIEAADDEDLKTIKKLLFECKGRLEKLQNVSLNQ